MIKNYFKTALRHFWRHKFFSLINIAGLSIGISASLVIYLLVSFDFSFDKFEKDSGRIYRIVSHFTYSGLGNKTAGVPYPMADAVRNELTGVEAVAPLWTWQGSYRGLKVSIPGQKGQMAIFRKQEQVVFADDNYFNLVPYKWIAGSSRSSLRQPYQVVLTQTNAALYFPNLTAAEIVGRAIFFNDSIHATVTGVVADINTHTDFAFKTFVSYSSLTTAQLKPEGWDYWGMTNPAEQVLIKLLPGISPGSINAQLAKLGIKYHQGEDARITTVHLLQPLKDMHFNADFGNFNGRVASRPTLYGLLAVAAFLLLLAAINFINLSTAQASQRAKEIGIRKTIGSSRKQLMLQFLCETFLLTLLSTLLSIAVAPVLLKIFSGFMPGGVPFNLFEQGGVLIALGVLVILVSLLAGIYPAVVLSSFKPVLILKKQVLTGGAGKGILLRKTLITAQFVIAQVFIIATIVVSRQIDYSLNADMGFEKNAIVYFDTNYGDTEAHRVILRDKINAIPGVSMVSRSNMPASYSGGMRGDILVYRDGQKEINTSITIKLGDSNYIKLYKIKLLAGGNLRASDTINSLLINETYARALGFASPQQAIGKRLYWSWVNRDVPIVGVIQDFHMRSFRETIKPLAIASRASEHLTFNIALSGGSSTWPSTIGKIQKAFKEVYPEDNWHYSFIDETIANYYKAEQYTSTLLKWATFLSIFISCLGLAGVALYITNQRQKEIGIRKVLGATVTQLLVLLSMDFLLFIGIAFMITVPAAWWWADSWLQEFAYKTTLSWDIFVMAGIFMGGVALLTISLQTIRAALANPVKSLTVE